MTFDSPTTTVIRPSRGAYQRAIAVNVAIAFPIIIVMVIRGFTQPWQVPILIGTFVVCTICVQLYFRITRIEYGDGNYRAVSLLGWSRRFAASDAVSLVLVAALDSHGVLPTSPQLFVAGGRRRPLLRLPGQTWELGQMGLLADDLMMNGVPADRIGNITTDDFHRRHPQLLAWWRVHPRLAGLLVGVGVVALVWTGILLSAPPSLLDGVPLVTKSP